MHSIRDLDASLIARYLSGECTREESAVVQRWVSADPGHAAQFAELERMWSEAAKPPIRWDTDAMWSGVAARLAPGVEVPGGTTPSPTRIDDVAPGNTQRHRNFATPIALLGILVLAIVGPIFSAITSRGVQRDDALGTREYITGRAERATMDLPDGSRIILGPATTLRYSPSFGKTDRTLFVIGEAYVSATSNAKLPLVVNTIHTTTQVLGTTFSVRAYPEDSAVRVVVIEGKVALRLRNAQSGSGTVLIPGTQGTLDSAGLVNVVSGVDTSQLTAWKDGVLQFRQVPLRSIVKDLERWYGVNIVLHDPSLGLSHVTGSFGRATQSVDLAHLARALGAMYKQNGDTIVFTPTE